MTITIPSKIFLTNQDRAELMEHITKNMNIVDVEGANADLENMENCDLSYLDDEEISEENCRRICACLIVN